MKEKFHIFTINPNLTYLDTAATSIMPSQVANKIHQAMLEGMGSPHRGSYKLSLHATQQYDLAKESIRRFFKVPESHDIIFTKSCTESINFLAYALGKQMIRDEANVVIPITSHHCNILPWQRLRDQRSIALRFVENDEGNYYNYQAWMDQVDQHTAVISFPWVTNGLGIDLDAKWLVELGKKHGAVTIIDAAQVVAHQKIDMSKITPDFLVFSGHKMYGPQGIGVIIGRRDLLENLPPYQLGGDMIEYVTKDHASFAEVPNRFEAGTQNVLGAIGLMYAIEFLESIGMDQVEKHEYELLNYAYKRLKEHEKIKVYGPNGSNRRKGLIVFNIEGIHPHDVASILDDEDIAIRAGHHCCQPLNTYLRVAATCRLSLGIYNSKEDIDRLMEGINEVIRVMGGM